jgi:hypothetical protein
LSVIKLSALIIFSTFDKRGSVAPIVNTIYLRFSIEGNEWKQPGKVPLRHFLARDYLTEKLARRLVDVVSINNDKNLTRSAVILIRLNPVRTGLMGGGPICAMITGANRVGNDNRRNASASMSHCCNIEWNYERFSFIDDTINRGSLQAFQ